MACDFFPLDHLIPYFGVWINLFMCCLRVSWPNPTLNNLVRTFLEAGSPRSRCRQRKLHSQASSLGLLVAPISLGTHMTSSFCAWRQREGALRSLFLQTLIPLDQGPSLITSSLLNSCKYSCTSDWNFSI